MAKTSLINVQQCSSIRRIHFILLSCGMFLLRFLRVKSEMWSFFCAKLERRNWDLFEFYFSNESVKVLTALQIFCFISVELCFYTNSLGIISSTTINRSTFVMHTQLRRSSQSGNKKFDSLCCAIQNMTSQLRRKLL